VVVWKLDRLARSLKQLLTIGEEYQSLGVDLVSLRQNIDTTLPAGRLTFQIRGAVAEFERELLRKRVKSGMAQARRSGKHCGRPALRRFQPIDIQQMQELRSKGTSVRKLAQDFETTQWMVARLTNGASERLGFLNALPRFQVMVPFDFRRLTEMEDNHCVNDGDCPKPKEYSRATNVCRVLRLHGYA